MKNHIPFNLISKLFLIAAAVCLAVSVFVPIWRIDLDAPQYPEGLMLQIYASKLGGNVEIINGLNHYIGMKTLHAEEFVEFTVLPYILVAFALFALFTAFSNNIRIVVTLLISFAAFGVVAMIDFWRWEYDYGHNLDPNAAIIVPGMAYQPPLIGFKQLLNFGAYSMPDLGGWLMLAAGLMIAFVVVYEKNLFSIFRKKSAPFAAMMALAFLVSCSDQKPDPINLNKDECANCQMTISDPKFAAELITPKGRVYKFDDVSCLVKFTKEENQSEAKLYVADYMNDNGFIEISKAYFIHGEALKSPMRGNIAAFTSQEDADAYTAKSDLTSIPWNDINK